MSMHPSIRRFIEHVRKECEKHGVTFRLVDAEAVDQGDGCGCQGFFDGINKVLSVAKRNRGWHTVLAHEFCHLRQWTEDAPVWMECKRYENWFFDWVAGRIEKPKRLTDAAADAFRELELDCERRTTVLIRRWKLPCDLKLYVRAANAYVLYYTFIRYNRVWYSRGPYRIHHIMAPLPTRFMPKAWYTKLPPAYAHGVFRRCLSNVRQAQAWRHLLAA